MTPLTEKERLRAALAVVRSLHEDVRLAEKFPSGTSITPVGTEDGNLYVAIKLLDHETNVEMERVACLA